MKKIKYSFIEMLEILKEDSSRVFEDSCGCQYRMDRIEGITISLGNDVIPLAITSEMLNTKFVLLQHEDDVKTMKITHREAKRILTIFNNAVFNDVSKEEKSILIDSIFDIGCKITDELGMDFDNEYYDIKTLELQEY